MRYNVRIEDEKVMGAENHSALIFAEAINVAMNGMAAGDVVTISPMRESERVRETTSLSAQLDEVQAMPEGSKRHTIDLLGLDHHSLHTAK